MHTSINPLPALTSQFSIHYSLFLKLPSAASPATVLVAYIVTILVACLVAVFVTIPVTVLVAVLITIPVTVPVTVLVTMTVTVLATVLVIMTVTMPATVFVTIPVTVLVTVLVTMPVTVLAAVHVTMTVTISATSLEQVTCLAALSVPCRVSRPRGRKGGSFAAALQGSYRCKTALRMA